MLLHSCPDTVHRFLLRKTQTSTPLIEGSFTRRAPPFGNTPAVADCRYRAPLSPRLHGMYQYNGFFTVCQMKKVVAKYKILYNRCSFTIIIF